MPVGFWFRPWKGAELWYSLIEKQLAAAYSTLQAHKRVTGWATVIMQTTYPIAGWVHSWIMSPWTGMVQTSTLAKWGHLPEATEYSEYKSLSSRVTRDLRAYSLNTR